jgi:hypothetical protein
MKSTLIILTSIVGVLATMIGVMMMAVPDGNMINSNVSILKTTSFRDFKVPGLILFLTVGISNLIAFFYLFVNHKSKFSWSMSGGILLIIWIVAQFILIESSRWVDVIVITIGALIVFISMQLKGKELI